MLESIAEAVPSTGTLELIVLAFLAGATTPTYYAQERLRGFGRAVASRLPYKPPAGMETAEAMEEVTEQVEKEE